MREREREREKQSSEMGRSQYYATDEEVQSASPSSVLRREKRPPESNAAGWENMDFKTKM
jgi:hypothetical protein